MSTRSRLLFVVESGTDSRMVEGLAARFELDLLVRRIPGGRSISQSVEIPAQRLVEGPESRIGFAMATFRHVLRFRAAGRGNVLVQGYSLAALAANLARLFTPTSVTQLVCSPAEEYYNCRKVADMPGKPFRRSELLLLHTMARLTAGLAQHYVVLSDHLASVVRRQAPAAAISIIPVYGVDPRVFHPAALDAATLRQRLGLPPHGPIIFFSSRVAPEKDTATLLLAFRKLLASHPDAWLLNLSGGFSEFLDLATSTGIRDRVISRDAVDPRQGLADFYRASSLCVQASRAEGLGFSVLEAMACGTPVVAARVGGLIETVHDTGIGWSYLPGDPIDLAHTLHLALSSSPAEKARRIQRGLELVGSRFDSVRAFDQLAKTLEGLPA